MTNRINITKPTEVLIIISINDNKTLKENIELSYQVKPENRYKKQNNNEIIIVDNLPTFSRNIIKFSLELINFLIISNQLKINKINGREINIFIILLTGIAPFFKKFTNSIFPSNSKNLSGLLM
jgi:hypothetical protein